MSDGPHWCLPGQPLSPLGLVKQAAIRMVDLTTFVGSWPFGLLGFGGQGQSASHLQSCLLATTYVSLGLGCSFVRGLGWAWLSG